ETRAGVCCAGWTGAFAASFFHSGLTAPDDVAPSSRMGEKAEPPVPHGWRLCCVSHAYDSANSELLKKTTEEQARLAIYSQLCRRTKVSSLLRYATLPKGNV